MQMRQVVGASHRQKGAIEEQEPGNHWGTDRSVAQGDYIDPSTRSSVIGNSCIGVEGES